MTGSVSRLVCGLVLLGTVTCAAAERIDPRLLTQAASGERLHVLIVLTRQPQRDIVLQAEKSWQVERNAARTRAAAAVGTPFPLEQDVNAARADLDRIDFTIRRDAIETIRRAIQPQQDRVVALLRSYGATNTLPYTVVNAMSTEVPPAILPALEADSDIATVSPVTKLHPQLSMSVPAIQAPAFWAAY